jgi:hypothetical protein
MITDGTFVCSLCGEWLAGCYLCGEAALIDRREAIAKQRTEEFQAERELANQERAIRQGAYDRNYQKTSDDSPN